MQLEIRFFLLMRTTGSELRNMSGGMIRISGRRDIGHGNMSD